MPDRPKLVPNEHTNRPSVGESGAQYATDATKVMENYRALAEAIGSVLIDGQDCDEGTVHYGSSDSTHCRITAPDDRLEVGDILILGEGPRVWQFELEYDREIEIEDADLIDGTAGTSNYDTIKDSLHIWVVAKDKITKTVTKDLIQLSKVTGGKSGTAFTAADIQISEADTDKVGDRLEELETDFGVEHDADGTHSDGKLTEDVFTEDACIKNGFYNALFNGFFHLYRYHVSDDVLPDGWTLKGSPSAYGILSTTGVYGAAAWRITASANGDGMKRQEGAIPNATYFIAEVYLKAPTGSASLTIDIYDGTTSTSKNQTVGTDWTALRVRHELTAGATYVQVRIYSAESGAQIFDVSHAVGMWGNFAKDVDEDARTRAVAIPQMLTFHIATVNDASFTTKAKFTLDDEIVPTHFGMRICQVSIFALTAPAGGNAEFQIKDSSNTIALPTLTNGSTYAVTNYGDTNTDTDLAMDIIELQAKKTAGTAAANVVVTIIYLALPYNA